MSASYTTIKGPQTTTEDVPAEEDVVRINHEHAERMDGAFLSIVFSAAIPCGLIIVVTAILLGVIYVNKVDTYTGWSELHVGQNGTNTSTGVWAAINSWKKHGGNAALFVNFNPSSLTAVASLTGKIIPYLSSSIMALVAFFVARRIILVSKDSQGHELPTPRQMSLLIQLLGGNSYGPLKDTVHYHIKHKKRWISPIPHAFSALAAVTALGIIIPVADTWFSTTVTPVHVAKVEKVTDTPRSPFGRDFSDPEDACGEDNWWYPDDGNNGWKLPCNMIGLYYNKDVNHTTVWDYSISNANQAALTIANLSDTNTVNDWYNSTSDPVHHYKYLAHTGLGFATDFRAKTVAVKTQCAPMTEQCFQACFSDNPDEEDNCRYLNNSYAFQCSPGFTGELTSNGASWATSLRKNSSVGSTGFGFALDASLSQMIGHDPSKVEFAAFTNPLYFGTWSLGWQNMPDDDYDDAGGGNPKNKDPWDLDRNIFWDANYYYAWMLNCSTEISYAYYEWINGTTHSFTPWPAPQEIGGMVSYPFVSGLPLGELCAQSAASHMKEANNSTQLANLFADYFSTCALGIMAGNINPTETILEQTRNNNYGATRVPIVPLFVLLGFKFLYCLAVLCLAIAAYHYTNPAEAQSVKERLTIKGLAATYFCDTPSHQQVAVQNVEQLFRSPEATNAAGDAEAAVPAEQKVGIVQTEMGGWQFVKMTASKVYDAVGPIVEKQLMSDANAGNFGTDGKDVANWVSLVQK
ncbi:uncharacterized protein Z520_07494 [Fonsecaea multimorphosa CBS 102226]|uniref:Uncharacterized protein n=1 Tax=Fonsecaea multimorphosa CBS 102226 TaxID=1442371 RepID=A0A0D2K179_9EURO|nr:uncharacterized protein Z520_07494 [Fonsecaea multimorphosa CBS 102226]KIX96774.1 hypothetical protein Z520_07494 [Fonsecaea multimorphosa CBS 102226]OAL22454.1 hypothetical protein AYO22_07012 [Fonsecaea multimorphosa]